MVTRFSPLSEDGDAVIRSDALAFPRAEPGRRQYSIVSWAEWRWRGSLLRFGVEPARRALRHIGDGWYCGIGHGILSQAVAVEIAGSELYDTWFHRCGSYTPADGRRWGGLFQNPSRH